MWILSAHPNEEIGQLRFGESFSNAGLSLPLAASGSFDDLPAEFLQRVCDDTDRLVE